jgi:hypothetical protein
VRGESCEWLGGGWDETCTPARAGGCGLGRARGAWCAGGICMYVHRVGMGVG